MDSFKNSVRKNISKIIVTMIFIGAFSVHVFVSAITLDSTGVILLCLVFVPWIFDAIKSLEINGLGKIELVSDEEKDKIEEETEQLNFEDDEINNARERYTWAIHIDDDPQFALAGMRMEIESTLNEIARKNSLDRRDIFGIYKLSSHLIKNEKISMQEYNLIRDMNGILNAAVHGKLNKNSNTSYRWAFDQGLKLLASLKNKEDE